VVKVRAFFALFSEDARFSMPTSNPAESFLIFIDSRVEANYIFPVAAIRRLGGMGCIAAEIVARYPIPFDISEKN
jgi:hypothetical protein